jgi:hypothetical protein
MNEEQFVDMLADAVRRFKLEQVIELEEMMIGGKSSAAKDIELGRERRKMRRN